MTDLGAVGDGRARLAIVTGERATLLAFRVDVAKRGALAVNDAVQAHGSISPLHRFVQSARCTSREAGAVWVMQRVGCSVGFASADDSASCRERASQRD